MFQEEATGRALRGSMRKGMSYMLMESNMMEWQNSISRILILGNEFKSRHRLTKSIQLMMCKIIIKCIEE
jgi:hypothetical protein